MPERRVREPTSDRPSRDTLGAAPATPRVRLHDATLDHRPMQIDPLPNRDEPELVEAAERGQVRGVEGSVKHVEVFRLGGVGTSILEDLDTHPPNGTLTPLLHPQS
jgi:hypothetical protein